MNDGTVGPSGYSSSACWNSGRTCCTTNAMTLSAISAQFIYGVVRSGLFVRSGRNIVGEAASASFRQFARLVVSNHAHPASPVRPRDGIHVGFDEQDPTAAALAQVLLGRGVGDVLAVKAR